MKLTSVQQNAVKELLQNYFTGSSEVLFNAPTGSGKTFMISSFISKLIEMNSHEKLIFVIATLSSSELPKQFANKIEEYNEFFTEKLNVEYKQPPSKIAMKLKDYEPTMTAKENKILVVGKSTFGKKTIFFERGIFDGFLEQIKAEDYKLIYIRDEAHYGNIRQKLNLEEKAFEFKIQEASSFIVEMTASPKHKLDQQVIIKEEDLIGSHGHLIKQKQEKNIGISELNLDNINDEDLLDVAIKQFKKIKLNYNIYSKENGFEINPAMLIQVDSKTEKNSKFFKESLEMIKQKLHESNLIWFQYFGDEKISSTKENYSLQDASKINSPVDVIIFKIGPATGWDIPRACMLVQLRKVNSQSLNIQTLGRIRRNPEKNLEQNDELDKYYLYSNYQRPPRNLETYHLKENFSNLLISSGKIDRKIITRKNFEYGPFLSWFKKEFESLEGIKNFKTLYKNDFGNNDPILLIENDISEDNKIFGYYREKLNDLIDVEIFNLNIKKDNHIFYNVISPIMEDYLNKYNFEMNKGLYIFNRYFLNILVDKYYDVINKKYAPKYINTKQLMPKYYAVWEEKNKLKICFKRIDEIYGYNNSEKQKKYDQILDSNPEIIVMKRIIKLLEAYDNVSFFVKNPVFTGASFEYENDNRQISKSFLDFIIKYNNFDILIEVKGKGKKDYNNAKTELLANAYQNYMKDNLKNTILVIAKVDDSNNITYDFYQNFIKNEILDLEDLFNSLNN